MKQNNVTSTITEQVSEREHHITIEAHHSRTPTPAASESLHKGQEKKTRPQLLLLTLSSMHGNTLQYSFKKKKKKKMFLLKQESNFPINKYTRVRQTQRNTQSAPSHSPGSPQISTLFMAEK